MLKWSILHWVEGWQILSPQNAHVIEWLPKALSNAVQQKSKWRRMKTRAFSTLCRRTEFSWLAISGAHTFNAVADRWYLRCYNVYHTVLVLSAEKRLFTLFLVKISTELSNGYVCYPQKARPQKTRRMFFLRSIKTAIEKFNLVDVTVISHKKLQQVAHFQF